MEAAQEAISSPLLDNISIQGAAGVLINITGGMDLAIDEVTTISQIIQDAAGEDAEIIFGAVHDPQMMEEVRVTVIATGFGLQEIEPERKTIVRGRLGMQSSSPPPADPSAGRSPPPLNLRGTRVVIPEPRSDGDDADGERMRDLDIPTFIRRQMD